MNFQRKSEIASLEASKGNVALTKANEITEKKEYEVLKDFVTGANKRDKQLAKFTR